MRLKAESRGLHSSPWAGNLVMFGWPVGDCLMNKEDSSEGWGQALFRLVLCTMQERRGHFLNE